MFGGKEKAWIAGAIGLISAFVLQLTGAGPGPSADAISGFGSMSGEIFASLVVGGINAVMVYLVPNSGFRKEL